MALPYLSGIGYGCHNLSSLIGNGCIKANPRESEMVARTYPPAIGIPWGIEVIMASPLSGPVSAAIAITYPLVQIGYGCCNNFLP